SAALPLGYAPSQGPRSRPDDSDEGRTDQRPSRLPAPGPRGYISASAKYRSVAQPGSAPRSGRGGRRFKSCHSDQFIKGLSPDRPRKSRSATGKATETPFSLGDAARSEEHTSELQSPDHLVCRLLLEK